MKIDFFDFSGKMKRVMYKKVFDTIEEEKSKRVKQVRQLVCFHSQHWQEFDIFDRHGNQVGYYRICQKCQYGEQLKVDDDGQQKLEVMS